MIRHAPSIGIGIGLSLRSQGFGVSYVKAGRVLDYSTQVGPFTIVDKSGEGNTATLYSGRGLTMDAVNDSVTYDTGYGGEERTATVWMRVTSLGARTLNSAGGVFTFTPTATNVWEELSSTATVSGDLAWTAGSDFDIGDLTCATEHWTHNDWSNPSGNTSNGKTIVDSGPNQLHGTCTGCSGFTGEGIDPEVAGIVGLDDARWFNGTDSYVNLGAGDPLGFNGSGRIDFGCNVVIGAIPTSPEDIFYQYISGTSVGFSVDIQSSGQVRASGRSVSTDSFQSLLSTALVTVGETRIDAYIDYANDEIGISLNGGAYKTGSVVFGQTSFTYGSSTGNTRIGNSQYVGRFFTGSVFNVEIQEDSVVSNSYTGLGTSVTAWEDTIGSNDGTESGSFVSVGQKRATIPQTADKNWNKYQYFNGTNAKVTFPLLGVNDLQSTTVSLYFIYTDSINSRILQLTSGSASDSIYVLLNSTKDGTSDIVITQQGGGIKLGIDDAGLTSGDRVDLVFTTSASNQLVSGTYNGISLGTPTANGRTGFFSSCVLGSHDGVSSYYEGLIFKLEIAGISSYTGLGNDPWKDTIGSNDGTESGTFTRELVTASDANIQIDALGTAISEPRLNTQQINLFGEGEYSSTPDSASLDLTTAATWEVWGNFYGVPASTQQILTKQGDAGAGKRSWIIQKLNTGAAGEARFLQFSASDVATIATVSGIPDSVGMLSFTLDQSSGILAYFNGVPLTVSAHTPAIIGVSDAPVVIGSNAALLNIYDDKVGSTKIYNVALTAAEVLINYNTQKSLYGL